jgi:hypothetical protein
MVFLAWVLSLAGFILYVGSFYCLCCVTESFGMAAVAAVLEPLNAHAVGDARGLAFAIVGVFTAVALFTFVFYLGVALIGGARSADDDSGDVDRRGHQTVPRSAVVAEA